MLVAGVRRSSPVLQVVSRRNSYIEIGNLVHKRQIAQEKLQRSIYQKRSQFHSTSFSRQQHQGNEKITSVLEQYMSSGLQ